MQLAIGTALLGLLLIGAMFGFFYAWVCSIGAMQAMNASVRNAVFAPAMFGTPVVLLIAAGLNWQFTKLGAACFVAAAVVYILFGAILTFAVNVPMNEALALVSVPDDIDAAREIWQGYSPKWQWWNQARTVACGVALLLTGFGLTRIPAM